MGPVSVCSSCTGMCRQTRRVKGCDFVRTCISDADCPGLTSCMCDSFCPSCLATSARQTFARHRFKGCLIRARDSCHAGERCFFPCLSPSPPHHSATNEPHTHTTTTKIKKKKYISSCLKLISFHLFPSPLPSLSTHTKNVLCLISVHLLHFSDFC